MKKINIKSFIIGIFIGVLISSGVVYAATLIDSKDVTYTPSDNEFDASNVETALNELYTKITTNTDELNSEVERLETELDSSSTVYYVGATTNITANNSTTYNIKTKFPNIDYTTLTKNNFLVVSIGISDNPAVASSLHSDHWVRFWSSGSSVSYNASSGVVSVNCGTVTASDDSVSISRNNCCKIYLVDGQIK